MNLPVDVINKTLSTYNLRNKILQGETGVDSVTIELPLTYEKVDLSSLNYTMRGTYATDLDAVARASLTKVIGEDIITLTWDIQSEFTYLAGEMLLVLVGSDANGDIVFKLNGESISIKGDASETATETIVPSLAEQYAAQIEQGLVEIDSAIDSCVEATEAANEFVNLSHTHSNKSSLDLVSGTNTGDQDLSRYAELTDLHEHTNKSVLDNVSGTNTGDQTADDFNHNDLANKQGGADGEYYHMTQAQNTALHAHSNQTALDAVSGTNTGDQNAAGVSNTPAGNIAATTVQAAINELDTEKEAVASKVTSISETSTDTQYPSAKCTYGAISTHNSDTDAHQSIQSDIRTVEAIACGKATAYTFDTKTAMDAWLLDATNVAKLVVGDNLHIRAVDEYDYWWDGTAAMELEAKAPDLTDYYTKLQVDAAIAPVTSQLAEKANQGDMLNQSELVWTVGGINSTTGVETVVLNRLRCDLLNIRGIIRITFSTIRMICICFNGSACLGAYPGTYVEDVINMADVLAVYPTTTHVRFVAKRADDGDMVASDASSARLVAYKSTQSVYELIDNNKADIDTKVSDAVSKIITAKQLTWVLGTLNSTTGAESESTTRIRCGYIAFEELDAILVSNGSKINISAYDAHKNLLGASDWLAANVTRTRSELLAAYPSIAYIRILVMATSTDTGANITVTVLQALNRTSDWRNAIDGRTDGRYRFDDKFKVVAYSTIGVAPINTAEHFLYCAKNGFDGLKCDVRITSDDKLVLCHDDGFTLDGNGRITTFNDSSKTLIRAMTYADVIALEHAQQYEGAYCHPIGLNTYLRICKRYGKLPYITIRDSYIETIAPLLVTALRQYSMTRDCIVNSFTYDSLMAVRALDANIYLSEVFTPYNSTLRTAALTHAKANDNYMLAVFYADGTNTLSTMTSNADIVTFIANCIAAGIRLYGGQSTTDEEIDSIISLGFSGTQHKTVPVG